MAFWVIQTFNGLSFSMMLFLVAAGFTLIFGLLKIINIAHGSFYLLSLLSRGHAAYFGAAA